jgi:hypothetical protein
MDIFLVFLVFKINFGSKLYFSYYFNIRFEREKIEKLNSNKERENHRLTPQKKITLGIKGFY